MHNVEGAPYPPPGFLVLRVTLAIAFPAYRPRVRVGRNDSSRDRWRVDESWLLYGTPSADGLRET